MGQILLIMAYLILYKIDFKYLLFFSLAKKFFFGFFYYSNKYQNNKEIARILLEHAVQNWRELNNRIDNKFQRLENKIDFPQIKFSEDMIFCFKCMCLAENYIRVPFAANIHRVRANSVSQKFNVRDWLGVILAVLENLEDFMNKNKFDFQDRVMKFFIDKHFDFIKSFFADKNNFEVQKIFTDELIRQKNSRGKNILLANFCANKIGE